MKTGKISKMNQNHTNGRDWTSYSDSGLTKFLDLYVMRVEVANEHNFFFKFRTENCFPNVSDIFRKIPSKICFGYLADKIARTIRTDTKLVWLGHKFSITRTDFFIHSLSLLLLQRAMNINDRVSFALLSLSFWITVIHTREKNSC